MEITGTTLQDMFWHLLLSRRLDERAWVLHRQGKIAFHISGIGHEAAQIGMAYALERGTDYVTPYYRDLSLMIALGLTPREFMLGLMGKKGEPSSGGRQMPSHWSMREMNVVSQSSPVATQCTHAVGLALACKLSGDPAIVLCTVGEGATSQGEWYEAVNWAAIHALPVVFVVENNRFAISVRQEQQMAVKNVADKALGLGLPGVTVEGSDLVGVYRAVKHAADRARRGGGPALIEAITYRITPHSSDDDDRTYRTREEVEANRQRDPLLLAQIYLEAKGLLSPKAYQKMDARARQMVEDALHFAEAAPFPDPSEAAFPVYAEDIRRG